MAGMEVLASRVAMGNDLSQFRTQAVSAINVLKGIKSSLNTMIATVQADANRTAQEKIDDVAELNDAITDLDVGVGTI